MAQVLRMLSQTELPRGPHRDFTESLFSLYRDADRPTLRAISRVITDDFDEAVSTETIRRMLRGLTVPVHWKTVDTVLVALCRLAGLDPDEDLGTGRFDDQITRREFVKNCWNNALDSPNDSNPGPRGGTADPWAPPASDEPPF